MRRLLEMINTTLDIAEAESGAAKLKLTDIDLIDLVGDALELFQAIAQDQQITITADCPTSVASAIGNGRNGWLPISWIMA